MSIYTPSHCEDTIQNSRETMAKLVSLMFLQVLVVVLDLNNGTQILQEIHLHVLKTRLLSKRKSTRVHFSKTNSCFYFTGTTFYDCFVREFCLGMHFFLM